MYLLEASARIIEMGCLQKLKGPSTTTTPACKLAFLEKVKALATKKVLKQNLRYLKSWVASAAGIGGPICIACDGSRVGSKE
eukprot:9924261-Prorocentrum_lima.AAC.1